MASTVTVRPSVAASCNLQIFNEKFGEPILHNCPPGRRPQMPPFQEKIFLFDAKKVNQLAKISDDLF